MNNLNFESEYEAKKEIEKTILKNTKIIKYNYRDKGVEFLMDMFGIK
jgi:hypothetical protein